MRGIIFDIKKFALHDGPGIRTTIFFKGCSLDCWWCHNPESIRKLPEKIKVNTRENPDRICGTEEIFGKEYTIQEIMNEIRKDQVFYDESGGGATFSGGEPLLQLKFLTEILKMCKNSGIHTAIDTSGYVGRNSFSKIYAYTDLFLFDLKIIDDEIHRKFTGVSNKRILDNLEYLTEKGDKVVIRIPLIPEITDTERNLSELASYLMKLKNVKKIDLLPYNEIAESKYKRFNKPSRLGNLRTQDEKKLNEIRNYFGNLDYEISVRG